MRELNLGHSVLFFLDEVDFSNAGLAADPDTLAFAAAFAAASEEGEKRFGLLPGTWTRLAALGPRAGGESGARRWLDFPPRPRVIWPLSGPDVPF